jgi:hypothetical protein
MASWWGRRSTQKSHRNYPAKAPSCILRAQPLAPTPWYGELCHQIIPARKLPKGDSNVIDTGFKVCKNFYFLFFFIFQIFREVSPLTFSCICRIYPSKCLFPLGNRRSWRSCRCMDGGRGPWITSQELHRGDFSSVRCSGVQNRGRDRFK